MTSQGTADTRPVLIWGGGGFLGTNLTERMAAGGRQVINVSRSHLTRTQMQGVCYLAPDLAELADLVAQSACVIHMAHGSSPAAALPQMEANLAGSMQLTFALMRACAAHAVPLVYLSSGGAIYGPDAPVPTPESAPTYPISPYGVEKLVAERYLAIGAQQLGLAYRVLRISNPYGPWQTGLKPQGVIGIWMRNVLEGVPLELRGDGSPQYDYVYVDDVIEAMVRVMAYDGPVDTFNIGSGQGRSLKEILVQLRLLCGDGLRVNTHDAAPARVPVNVLDTSLAAQELGWRAMVDFEDGLRRSWDWMRQHHKGS